MDLNFQVNLLEESFQDFLSKCVSGFNISEEELDYLEELSLKGEVNEYGM